MAVTSYADKAHFDNYNPSSFGWPRRADLVPLVFNGVNFGHCARAAHPVFVALLTDMVPHIPGGLKKGSCWSYAATDDLPDGSWSFHHYGTAIDVNWNVNHMGQNIPDAHGKWAIPREIATQLAHRYGCEWGGNWRGGFHDNMHFEIHLSPKDARKVASISARIKATVAKALGRGARYPLRKGQYFGDVHGPANSIGDNHAYSTLIKGRLIDLGWLSVADAKADGGGIIGPRTATAISRFKVRQFGGKVKGDGKLARPGYRALMSARAKKAAR